MILAFAISAAAGSILVLLSIATWLFPDVQFWPPPHTNSWQYRIFWLLFRILILGIAVTVFLDFGGLGSPPLWQLTGGGAVAAVGFGLAFWITYVLGWRDAHGEANSLKTTGWYSWSRNPIYVVSIAGMIGLALLVHSAYVYTLLLLWALMYLAAPFLEEPWLEQHYGESFRQYKRRVNRFIGRRRSSR